MIKIIQKTEHKQKGQKEVNDNLQDQKRAMNNKMRKKDTIYEK